MSARTRNSFWARITGRESRCRRPRRRRAGLPQLHSGRRTVPGRSGRMCATSRSGGPGVRGWSLQRQRGLQHLSSGLPRLHRVGQLPLRPTVPLRPSGAQARGCPLPRRVLRERCPPHSRRWRYPLGAARAGRTSRCRLSRGFAPRSRFPPPSRERRCRRRGRPRGGRVLRARTCWRRPPRARTPNHR